MRRRDCRGRVVAALPAVVTVVLLCVTWVLMGEFIQGLQDGWRKPWFVTYVVHSGFAITLLPWFVLRARRTRRWPACADICARRAPAADADAVLPVSMRQLTLLGTFLSVLSAAAGFTWYLSLPETLVSANNAIYQSAAAAVFVLSVVVLGEAVTVAKLAALVTCVGGVVVVSFAPAATTTSGNIHETVAGYMWVLASVAVYAVYQVLYARYTEQALDSVATAVRCNYVAPANAPPTPRGAAASTEAFDRDAAAHDADADSVRLLHDHDAGTGSSSRRPSSEDGGVPGSHGPAGVQLAGARPARGADSPALRAELAAYMLGVVGIASLLFMWPLFFVFDATGVEPFEWPSPAKTRMLVLSAVLDAVYNAALLFGIGITSPLWTSLGTILVVPASMLADWGIHGATVSGQAGGGIAAILVGFTILQVPLPPAYSRPVSCRRRHVPSADTGTGPTSPPRLLKLGVPPVPSPAPADGIDATAAFA